MLYRLLSLQKLSNKVIFLLLMAMVLAHMVLFILYANYNKHAEANVNREILVQQVINLIDRVNVTNPSTREKVVKAVDIPSVNISLDKKPQWKLRFSQNSSLWQISEILRAQSSAFNLSLEYAPKSWLNITASIMQPRWWWLQIFLLILEAVVVTSILFSMWSINRFALPLKSFKKAADRLGVDLDTPPLKEYGPAIVRETAFTMNQLQTRIHDLIKERTQMLAALSHDLRTPITRIKLRTQFIEDAEIYQKNIADLDEMEAMIAETLAFAKNNNRLEKRIKLDLNSLLIGVCDGFKDMGFKIIFHSQNKRVPMLARPIALKRAFNNLIENAVKYGKKAEVHLQNNLQNKYQGKILIIIEDDGPGIPESLLEKVFEPFYRGDNSRSRETGGTGLGLAVARDIIRSHGGKIILENKIDKGLRVKIFI